MGMLSKALFIALTVLLTGATGASAGDLCFLDPTFGNLFVAKYNMAEVFLTQPLQIVPGVWREVKWMSDDLHKRAASTNKLFHVVECSHHMQLYDVSSMSTKLCRYWHLSSKQICKRSSTSW